MTTFNVQIFDLFILYCIILFYSIISHFNFLISILWFLFFGIFFVCLMYDYCLYSIHFICFDYFFKTCMVLYLVFFVFLILFILICYKVPHWFILYIINVQCAKCFRGFTKCHRSQLFFERKGYTLSRVFASATFRLIFW